ncbi:MAG: hypothetical protein PHX13_04290 [Thiovulaceae bacterium]|nr:hypothetical protein [Sulfurimonadaceae bacterium]
MLTILNICGDSIIKKPMIGGKNINIPKKKPMIFWSTFAILKKIYNIGPNNMSMIPHILNTKKSSILFFTSTL